MFSRKNSYFEFCFDCQGVSDPEDRFGVGPVGKLVAELVLVSLVSK
jgi:hypothetical protein